MPGGRSIKLARIFGVRIGVDPSWFVVLFLIVFLLSDAYGEVYPEDDTKAFLLAAVSALLFFGSVVLHELGHAWVAVRNGIGIAGIDLWLFGGVARMRRDAGSAGVEFRVAVAGPLVTLAIALACVGGGLAAAGSEGFADALVFDNGSRTGAIEAVLGYLAFVNCVLLAFNLIPGFPLDGGRIVRAIAWWRTGDRIRATRFAAALGRGFSWLLVGLGVVLLVDGVLISGLWLAFVGLFLGQAARAAEAQALVASRVEGLTVADVMDAQPVAVPTRTRLDRALDEFFLRYRWPWFPVVDGTGRFVGLVSRDLVERVPEALRSGSTVDEVMARDEAPRLRVDATTPLETLLGSEGLQRLGAMMVVDGEGVLRGVVTIDRVRRALRSPTAAA